MHGFFLMLNFYTFLSYLLLTLENTFFFNESVKLLCCQFSGKWHNLRIAYIKLATKQVPHSQSSLELLTKVLRIFSHEIGTHNFVNQCNSFYIRMPSLNYNGRYYTKILVKYSTIFSLRELFLDLKFCKNFVFFPK
jgi:hypothetical protein